MDPIKSEQVIFGPHGSRFVFDHRGNIYNLLVYEYGKEKTSTLAVFINVHCEGSGWGIVSGPPLIALRYTKRCKDNDPS